MSRPAVRPPTAYTVPPSDVTPRCSRGVGPGRPTSAAYGDRTRARSARAFDPRRCRRRRRSADLRRPHRQRHGERHARERSPRTALEDEGRSQRRAGHRVAAEHVRLAADTRRPSRGGRRSEGRQGAASVSRAGEYASTRRDAPPSIVKPPSTTISFPTAAADTSVRGSGIGARVSHADGAALAAVATTATTRSAAAQSLMSGGIHFEREPFDPAHDDRRAGIAASRAACLPDLAVTRTCPSGQRASTATPRLPTSDSTPTVAFLRFDHQMNALVSAISRAAPIPTATSPHGDGSTKTARTIPMKRSTPSAYSRPRAYSSAGSSCCARAREIANGVATGSWSTSSRYTISAASPWRWPSRTMRV